MITEWLVTVGTGLVSFFVGFMPDWEMPAELSDPGGMLAGIISLGQGLAPFVDWGFVSLVAAIPLVVWLIGIAWQAFRRLISHLPFGFGGNG